VELGTFVDDPKLQPNGEFGTFSLDQGKAFLAKLDGVAKKGEQALQALIEVRKNDHDVAAAAQ
jgi:hypothetical protein